MLRPWASPGTEKEPSKWKHPCSSADVFRSDLFSELLTYSFSVCLPSLLECSSGTGSHMNFQFLLKLFSSGASASALAASVSQGRNSRASYDLVLFYPSQPAKCQVQNLWKPPNTSSSVLLTFH